MLHTKFGQDWTVVFERKMLRPGPTDRWPQSVCKKDTSDDLSFGVCVIRFHPLQKIDKTVEHL